MSILARWRAGFVALCLPGAAALGGCSIQVGHLDSLYPNRGDTAGQALPARADADVKTPPRPVTAADTPATDLAPG